jgi:hypothetical protein
MEDKYDILKERKIMQEKINPRRGGGVHMETHAKKKLAATFSHRLPAPIASPVEQL